MRIDNTIHRRFPKLASWIASEIPKCRHEPKIFDAFVTHTGLSVKDANTALKYIGSQPTIDVRATLHDGVWIPRMPDKVFIRRGYCRRWERMDPDQRAASNWDLIMKSIILHEMVHWGDFKKDGRHRPNKRIYDPVEDKWMNDADAGYQFEIDAFYGIYSTRWL